MCHGPPRRSASHGRGEERAWVIRKSYRGAASSHLLLYLPAYVSTNHRTALAARETVANHERKAEQKQIKADYLPL